MKLHTLTLADGWCHKRKMTSLGTYRKYAASPSFKSAPPAEKINTELGTLIKAYEEKERIEFRGILDFHVRFERIHPFDDCNGRVGRMLMFKECLRHGIMPFILDDKRRTGYLKGIRQWDEDPEILTEYFRPRRIAYPPRSTCRGCSDGTEILPGCTNEIEMRRYYDVLLRVPI